MIMEDKLVKIAEFETVFEAELAKVRLEEAQINASVQGGDLVTMMVPLQQVRVELLVLEKDAERAKEILATQPQQPQ